MQNFFKTIDYLGFQPSLHIKGESYYKSLFTGVLSFFVALLSLLCAGYFGSELITRTTPSIIVSTTTVEDFTPLTVSNKGFLFMMSLEYDNFSYYSDPTVYQVHAFAQNISHEITANNTVEQTITNSEIEIDLCSKYYTNEDFEESNIHLPLDLFYCTKPDATAIQGFWGANIYANLRVELTKCVNSTQNNNHCRPIEEIDKIVQNGYISFDFTTYNIEPKNYSQPFKKLFQNEYNLLNANSSLEYSINLMTTEFISDNGLIFEDMSYSYGHSYKIDIFNRNIRSNYIVSFNFQGNSAATVYTRNYTKLQTVITQIGGFIKAIMLMATLISYVFSQNYFFISYIHSIFEPKFRLDSPHEYSIKNVKTVNFKTTYQNQNEKKNKTNFENVDKQDQTIAKLNNITVNKFNLTNSKNEVSSIASKSKGELKEFDESIAKIKKGAFCNLLS